MNRVMQLATGLVLASAAIVAPATARAEVSYNLGYASEYYFRGVLQKTSSGSAGIDFEQNGFYVGSWAADVGDGLEIDGYLGYGMEFDSGVSASIGYTGYFYTGEFDDTYSEINLGLGYGMFSLEYSVGEWDGFGAKQDYDFLALTVEAENGLYATAGTWGDDFDGEYLELGYGSTIAEIDYVFALILSSKELSDQDDAGDDPTGSEAVVFSIGKTF